MIDLEPLSIREAEEFWRNKVKLSPGQFAQLTNEAKTMAFGVSGIAKGDELTSVFNAMQKAVSQGISFGEFKKECRGVFERRGWAGKRAWRVDNIFRTNIQTAYSAGRYQQMRKVVKSRPYWQYSAINDSRTRPTHAALNGKIFPADHEFWNTWTPLNGYLCRCGVVTLSKSEIERDGLTVETVDPTGKLIEPIDPATGNRMPARLLMPDTGFANNPGKTVWGGIVDKADKPGDWKEIGGLKGPQDYGKRSLQNVRPAEVADLDESRLLPSGKGNEFYKAEFIKRYGQEQVIRDAVKEPVILSTRCFLKDKTPGAPESWKFDKPGHGETVPLLREMIEQPFEIWLTPQKNERGQIRLVKRYISLWKTADRKRIGGLAVFETVNGVFQGVTAFEPLKKSGLPDIGYVDRQRLGLLLWGK